MNKLLLKSLLEKIAIDIKEGDLEKFSRYQDLLLEWNQKMNLTAIEESEQIVIKHFYDSLLAMKISAWTGKGSLLDLGTGAGFPGVPLKIMNPSLQITLVDSLQKRVTFLNHVIETLHLEGIKAIHGRAEELGQDRIYREKYSWVVSRAVAQLPVLAEFCLPFLALGGYFIAYKGPDGEEESNKAHKALNLLGGRISSLEHFHLPDEAKRLLVVIKKEKNTPSIYPRRPGLPGKKPII